MSRREVIEKEKSAVFAKDIVLKNPIFSVDEIQIFFDLFNLYANEWRDCNINDILGTAKTLGFDKQHPLIYEAIYQIAQVHEGNRVRFQPFLIELTDKLGNPLTENGRRAMFELVDLEGKEKLTMGDLLKVSDYLGYGLTPDEIQKLIRNIVGPKERELSWSQFNEHIVKRMEKNKGPLGF